MICPACKNKLIVVEYNKIELDQCTQCHSFWFDSGELELLLKSFGLEGDDLFKQNFMNAIEAKTPEKKRKCPICGRKMLKETIGERPQVLIDVCQHGHGLWFDGGELTQLVTQLADKPLDEDEYQHRVINFLGEVFKI